MKVGLVSTWLHRGAAYVTINYAKLLMPEHEVFVYGRGGEFFDRNMNEDGVKVHEGYRINGKDGILVSDFVKWIKKNKIEIVIWNEQRDVSIICKVKKLFPKLLHGAYVDYYREDMIQNFAVYDFLLCNTKRHYSVFEWHPQCFYIPWGGNIELYKPQIREDRKDKIVFFHSMGMSNRKGTDALVRTFTSKNMKQYGAKLVIHTQVNIDNIITKEEAERNNIEIIEKTVTAPGLYYMGDVYVYPAKLDGLGLTMYEAICCGLPVITTDVAPMNEVITNKNGQLVKVDKYFSRSDGYYWPLAEINEESLYDALMYYVNCSDEIKQLSERVREDAVERWNLEDRKNQLLDIINSVTNLDNNDACDAYMSKYEIVKKREKRSAFINLFIPQKLFSYIKNRQLEKKYHLNK